MTTIAERNRAIKKTLEQAFGRGKVTRAGDFWQVNRGHNTRLLHYENPPPMVGDPDWKSGHANKDGNQWEIRERVVYAAMMEEKAKNDQARNDRTPQPHCHPRAVQLRVVPGDHAPAERLRARGKGTRGLSGARATN